MSYAIDDDGTRRIGTTLLTSHTVVKDCTTMLAHAAGQARAGLGTSHPMLVDVLGDFVATHVVALDTLALSFAGLGRTVRWVAESHRETELANAARLGAAGADAPLDSFGARP
jgi:hypothetical protein